MGISSFVTYYSDSIRLYSLLITSESVGVILEVVKKTFHNNIMEFDRLLIFSCFFYIINIKFGKIFMFFFKKIA